MDKARKVLSWAAHRLDLPQDIMTAVPRVEILGTGEFFIQPHKGLIEYDEKKISVATNIGKVSVFGERMTICHMNSEHLRITGEIRCVELGEGEHE